jgi:hypothetical protein
MKKHLIYQVSKKSKHFKYTEDPTDMISVSKKVVKFANYRRKFDHLVVWAVQTGWGKPVIVKWGALRTAYPRQRPIITKFFMRPEEAFRVIAAYCAATGEMP